MELNGFGLSSESEKESGCIKDKLVEAIAIERQLNHWGSASHSRLQLL